MEQATFAELEHDSKRRRTRREIFLEKMDRPGPGVDGAARMRSLRDDRAAARAGAGHRGFDDAVGASHGGLVVLLRGGGQAAGGVGGRELRGETHRAHDALGGRRRGVAAPDGAVGSPVGDLGCRRRRGAAAQAVEGGRDPVRGAGRHGGAGATVGDRGPGRQRRRPGGHPGGEGRRAVAARARRRGRPAHRGRVGANASRSDAPSRPWRARRTTSTATRRWRGGCSTSGSRTPC